MAMRVRDVAESIAGLRVPNSGSVCILVSDGPAFSILVSVRPIVSILDSDRPI